MTEPKTTVAQVRFQVEREEGDRALIRVQQQHVPGIPVLRYGALRLDLEPGVGAEEAERLADLLNEKVHSLVYTGEDLAAKEKSRG